MKVSLIFNEIIKMKIVLICILKLILISFISTQNTGVPTFYCFIVGQLQFNVSNYQFSLTDLPERCQVIIYGNYDFGSNTTMYKEDESAIQSMVENNKTVYVYIGYQDENRWPEIFDPQDQDLYNQLKGSLIKALKDFKISGVVFGVKLITMMNYAEKMGKFIDEVKAEIPTLKFGMPVNGVELFIQIGYSEAPDFSITNSLMDFYEASVFDYGYVYDYKCGNLVPPSSDNITLELLCQTFNQSGIDMKKAAGSWNIGVVASSSVITVSELCKNPDPALCLENSLAFYERGACIKTFFPWLEVGCIDFDDTNGTCECRKYPATNVIFDGWEQKPKVECPKMDRK